MTREDAINKIKEAVKQIKYAMPRLGKETEEALTFIVPELAETEDERIRKALVIMMKVPRKEIFEAQGITKEQALAYLEKQKEPTTEELYAEAGTTEKEYIANTMKQVRAFREKQKEKPEWSGEDEKKINFLSRLIEFQVKDDEYCFGDGRLVSKQEAIEMLKSFRPQQKQEWSEEDEILRVRTINRLETLNFHGISSKEIHESIDWLKSLRPVSKDSLQSWKPSEEQMEALKDAFRKDGCNEYRKVINSLYCDLQKLL